MTYYKCNICNHKTNIEQAMIYHQQIHIVQNQPITFNRYSVHDTDRIHISKEQIEDLRLYGRATIYDGDTEQIIEVFDE